MSQRPGASHTAYSSRVTNWYYISAGAICASVMILLGHYYDSWSILGVLVLVGCIYGSRTSIRTTAGTGGVVVRYGLFGLPRWRYPAATIARADVIDIPNARIGIWWSGWRNLSWKGHHYIRTGPSLQLHLIDGRRVVITTDDPDAAAAVVNAYAPIPT